MVTDVTRHDLLHITKGKILEACDSNLEQRQLGFMATIATPNPSQYQSWPPFDSN